MWDTEESNIKTLSNNDYKLGLYSLQNAVLSYEVGKTQMRKQAYRQNKVTQLGTRLGLENSSILSSGERRAPPLHLHPSSLGTGYLHLKAQNMPRHGTGSQTLTPAKPRKDLHSRLVLPLPHWAHPHRLRVASAPPQTPRPNTQIPPI